MAIDRFRAWLTALTVLWAITALAVIALFRAETLRVRVISYDSPKRDAPFGDTRVRQLRQAAILKLRLQARKWGLL